MQACLNGIHNCSSYFKGLLFSFFPTFLGEHTVRFVPKEEGTHHLHARLNGIHIPGSPFKLEVEGGNNNNNVLSDDPSSVAVRGAGIDRGTTGKASKVSTLLLVSVSFI